MDSPCRMVVFETQTQTIQYFLQAVLPAFGQVLSQSSWKEKLLIHRIPWHSEPHPDLQYGAYGQMYSRQSPSKSG